jgi:hypothetical protein
VEINLESLKDGEFAAQVRGRILAFQRLTSLDFGLRT